MRAIAWVSLGLIVLALLMMLSGTPAQWGGVVLIGPIPIVLASSPTMAALTIGMAIVLIVVAMLLMYVSTLPLRHEMHIPTEEEPPEQAPKRRVEGGAVIMIGPIPLVFGSDKRMALVAMVLALALMVVWLIFLLLL